MPSDDLRPFEEQTTEQLLQSFRQLERQGFELPTPASELEAMSYDELLQYAAGVQTAVLHQSGRDN
jgi:hypothetical protein